MSKTILRLFVAVLAALPLAMSATARAQTAQAAPVIQYYNASPPVIDTVQAVHLTWKVNGATRVDVYDGFRNTTYPSLATEGGIDVWPEQTATYTLYAYGDGGQVVTAQQTITVNPPAVEFFYASATQTLPGQPVRLWWRVRGGTRVDVFDSEKNTVYPDLGRENTIEVYPQLSATYTLQVYGPQGLAATQQIMIYVDVPYPVIGFFNASSRCVRPGEGLTLTWHVDHAKRLEIRDSLGQAFFPNLPADGNLGVAPGQTVTYYLSAYDSLGRVVSSSVQVRVQP